MRIYDSSGYVNVRGILDEGYPFNFLVGGRGTGKTYTTLKVAKEDGRRFMLMRRTQSQADLSVNQSLVCSSHSMRTWDGM